MESRPSFDPAANLLLSNHVIVLTLSSWKERANTIFIVLPENPRIIPSQNAPKSVDPLGEKHSELMPPALQTDISI